jgi:endonuclease/exonuclease/phosphatase family metal-dependent hydrolase
MIAVHHKSGREYGYLRGAEAKRTAEIGNELLKADPEARVVILGDFNAQGDELAVKSYIDAGYIDLYGDRERDDATSVTHSSGRAIDHMMFNANFAKVVAKGSRFVLGTIDRPKGVDWRTTPEPAGWASDHYPVVVDFRPVN